MMSPGLGIFDNGCFLLTWVPLVLCCQKMIAPGTSKNKLVDARKYSNCFEQVLFLIDESYWHGEEKFRQMDFVFT